jgi:hypothetical protein
MFEFCLEHSPYHLLLMAGNALVQFEEREHQGIARERVRFKEPEHIDSKYCAESPSVKGNRGSAGKPLNRDQPFDIKRKSCQMATQTLNARVHYSEPRAEKNLLHLRPPGSVRIQIILKKVHQNVRARTGSAVSDQFVVYSDYREKIASSGCEECLG